MNKCDTHPEHDSLASCTVCGKSVCKECRVKLVKKDYCQDCADDIVKNGAIVTLRKLYDLLQEKRKHQRVHVLLPVAFAAADERAKVFKGIIHNISSGGLGIIADAPFSINEPVVLDFKLPNGTRLEWRQGGVVRCSDSSRTPARTPDPAEAAMSQRANGGTATSRLAAMAASLLILVGLVAPAPASAAHSTINSPAPGTYGNNK